VTFNQKDAEKAGLWRKQGTWQQYPKRMLQLRARAFAFRDAFADVLKGLQVREEIEDIRDAAIDADTVPEPKATPAPAEAPEPKAMAPEAKPKDEPAAAEPDQPAAPQPKAIVQIEVAKVTASSKEGPAKFWIYDADGQRIGARLQSIAEAARDAKKTGNMVELGLDGDGLVMSVKQLSNA